MTINMTETPPALGQLAPISAWTAWRTVLVLAAAYVFSYIDRQLLALLVEPVRNDLRITDTQVSVLTGLAFGLCYSLTAIPLGQMADRGNRRTLAFVGFAIWSLMTVGCGFARNYGELLVARMGVAIGEAALTPTAYSLLADIFPPRRLALPMGVFVLGAPLGTAGAYLAGGWMVGMLSGLPPVTIGAMSVKPWQMCFVVIGVAGLLTSLTLLLIHEPRMSTGASEKAKRPRKSGFRVLIGNPPLFGRLMIAIALTNVFLYGFMAWLAAYFMRVHGLTVSQAGTGIGLSILVCGVPAPMISGWAGGRMLGAGRFTACLDCYAIGTALVLAGCLGMIVSHSLALAYVGMALTLFGYFFISGAFPPLIQLITSSDNRGQISALILLAANLAGLGIGPTFVAFTTDYVFGSTARVGSSIMLASVVLLPPALYLMVTVRPAYRDVAAKLRA